MHTLSKTHTLCTSSKMYPLYKLDAVHTSHADSESDPVTLTNFPALHPMQATDAFEPANATYRPAPQSVHACVDAAENFPASHAVHVVPPLAASASVTDPPAHAAQAAVEAAE